MRGGNRDGRYRVGRQQASFEAGSPVVPPDAVIEFVASCEVDFRGHLPDQPG